jgi:cysteine desulfurase
MEKSIYLDYNATTPSDAEVVSAMQPFLDQLFGNPSSSHIFGTETRKAVEMARKQLAGLIHCAPDEIIFTSGGTESNNLAIKGTVWQLRHAGNHIITSKVEHPAVSEVCRFLETQGFVVTWLDVDEYGQVNPEDVKRAITPSTILISVMHANNEVGTIQPVEEIGRIARDHRIVFHCDAAQSAGKIPVEVGNMKVDLLSLAGHKFYAPKGVGALYVRRGIKLQKLMHGADHEQNLRAGTENVIEIAGLGKAAEICLRDMDQNSTRMRRQRDRLHQLLADVFPDIRLNGHPEQRLPNTLNISIPGIDANTLLSEIPLLAASAGAACHAGQATKSLVLDAMGADPDRAMGAIRFSTGKPTTDDEIEQAAELIIRKAKQLVTEQDRSHEIQSGPESIKLTRYTHGLGCACKIRPQVLEQILRDLPRPDDKRIITGPGTSDDAAVYQLTDTIAIVQTVDFFSPIVDDPYDFGAIAAANALSDIYAMGAKPIFALNILGFPTSRLPIKVLKEILKGAADKAAEAGIYILGGHSIEENEPRFGMAVSGIIDPGKVLTNANAQPGDALVLTKPIGSGIISTAVKRGLADEPTAKAARDVMITLNDKAAKVMTQYPVNACTDVTGFGLLGHLKEMAVASGVQIKIDCRRVPLIKGTEALAAAGAIPGGSRSNQAYVEDVVKWSDQISELMKTILCDAQTSGGLIISLPQKEAENLVHELMKEHDISASIIGEVQQKGNACILV